MNPTSKPLLNDTILAAANLTANRFIGFDGNLCGADAKALGVCLQDTLAAAYAPVGVFGILVVETGGYFSAGAAVASDSSGRAVEASPAAVSSAITADTSVSSAITANTTVTPTVTVSVPAGETPVTSAGAQPTLTVNASATGSTTATAVNTATTLAAAVNTPSGGALPQAVNGYALDASGGSGEFVRVVVR